MSRGTTSFRLSFTKQASSPAYTGQRGLCSITGAPGEVYWLKGEAYTECNRWYFSYGFAPTGSSRISGAANAAGLAPGFHL